MKKFAIQILIVLLFVVSLPVVFVIINRSANLTENEEIVQRAFNQQLETLLYTINQNSENIIKSWINQIYFQANDNKEIYDNIVDKLLHENSSLHEISFYKSENLEKIKTYSFDGNANIDAPDAIISQKLTKLIKQNYQKIESKRKGEFTNLYFMLKFGDDYIIGAFLIHTKTFIEQNLRPGIQQRSQNRLNIIIYDTMSCSDTAIVDTLTVETSKFHKQNLWYIPDYVINIQLKNATIDELVRARSKQSNSLFIALLIVVLFGVIFVVFSIQKEIRLAELKSEFVSNVSHEIRTPLALISMYAETLLLKRITGEQKSQEYLKVIHLETNRLTALVNRILSFSKIENKKRNFDFSLNDINSIIIETIEVFKPQLQSEKVNLNLDLTEKNSSILVDKDAISESLINLIDNAIKYGNDQERKITIRTFSKSKFFVIEVEDNGIGIEHKHLKNIFDKFYRVTSGNLAHKAKGSGLGLNIVQQIMKRHNGKITVQSKIGKGSCFSLIFPQKSE